MSREVLIDTPENIALEYELAGLGTRFCANITDTFLQILLYAAVFLAAGVIDLLLMFIAHARGWALMIKILSTLSDFITAGAIILSFVVFWGYYIYYEYKWNGQTPGKRQLGLRVIREGGYPVDLYSVILRTLLRIVDFLPVCYFVGIVSILFSKNYQRLGDMLAGTMVVKQRAPQDLVNLLQATRLKPEHLDRDALLLMQREADRLTREEYRAVRHFTERRRSLSTMDAQQSAAMALAIPLMERLHIVPPEGVSAVNYADVLEYLAVAYENARRPKEPRVTNSP